jgi:hypothetical protein
MGILWKSGRTFLITEDSIGQDHFLLHMHIHFHVMCCYLWYGPTILTLLPLSFLETSETGTASIMLTLCIISC